ncbi:hypothetical protein NT04LS_0003a, partial [Listeria seeligeri FSL S4-171]
ALTKIFFTFRSNSRRGIITLWPQPSHLIRMSIPMRIILKRLVPQGCGFFISTTSFKSKCFFSINITTYSSSN